MRGPRARIRRRATRIVVVFPLVAALASAGCPSLDDIPLEECGNGIVEEDLGEECDTPPEAEDEDSRHCARPNEANACHWVWSESVCCPDGSSQGVDRKCRTPSGTFDTTAPLLRLTDPVLGTGTEDVDGDGWEDLAIRYQSREIEIRFLGPDANHVPVRDVHPSDRRSQATFGQLDEPFDATLDGCNRPTSHPTGAAFIPTPEGVRVLLGRPGGSLLPKAFANFETFVPSAPVALPWRACRTDLFDLGDVLPDELSCTGAFAGIPGGGLRLLGVDLSSFENADPFPLFTYPGLNLEALGTQQPERIALPTWSGCDGVLVRFGEGAKSRAYSISVLGLCGPDDGDAVELFTLDLSDHDARAFVIDADHDGVDDIVVATNDDLAVHLGDGEGGFDLAYAVDNPQADDEQTAIALGFLDEDEAFDIVHPNGVWTTHGACGGDPADCTFQLAGVNEDAMEEAVLADVNGDGQKDVVARVTDDINQKLVLVGTSGPSGIYSFDERPVPNPPRHFSTQDYDGDGIDDVAFVLSSKGQSCLDPQDDVQVIYGEHGTPGDAITVAQLAGVTGLAGGVLLPTEGRADGIGDLGLSTTCTDEATGQTKNRASIVHGNQQRSVDSPYLLPEAGQSQENVLFASGRIDGDAHPDLVALGYAFDDPSEDLTPYLLWVIPVQGNAELPPSRDADGKPTGLGDEYVDGVVSLFTADLDCKKGEGDCGDDEIVVFQSSGGSAASASRDEPRLSIFETAGKPFATTGSCGLKGSGDYVYLGHDVEDEEGGGVFSNALAVDLDGDGLKDVVAYWLATEGQSLVAADAYVFWNGPDGFDGTCPVRLTVPEGEVVIAASPFRFGAADAETIVIATNAGVYRATFDATRDANICATGSESCQRVFSDPLTHNAEVVDYDLDGLEDLVVAVGPELLIYPQKALDEVRREAARRDEPEDDE